MKNGKWTTITDILLLTVSFVIFVDSLLVIKEVILLKQKLFIKVFQNRNLYPIEEISIMRNMCDKENGFTSFLNYTFLGINGGSYNTGKKTFSDSKCVGGKENCIDIPTLYTNNLPVWQDNVLCLKRLEESAVTANLLFLAQYKNCPEGFRQCGYLNEYHDKLCTKNGFKCPINHIEFKRLEEITGKEDKSKVVCLNSQYCLVFSNNFTDNILPIDFTVAEDYPCLESERISYNISYPPFPRINKKNLYGCNSTFYKQPNTITDIGIDGRYEKVNLLSKSKFFKNNDLDYKYASIPNVDDWINDLKLSQFYLFKRGYISLNITCSCLEIYNITLSELENSNLNCSKTEFLIESRIKLDRLKILKYLQLIFSITNIFTLCFFISLLSLVKIVKRWLHLSLTIAKILLSSSFVVYSIFKVEESIHITQFINYNAFNTLNKCSDDYLKNSMKRLEISLHIGEIERLDIFYFISSILLGIIILVQFLRLCYKVYIRIKNRKRREQARNQLGFRRLETEQSENIKTALLEKNNKMKISKSHK